MSDSAKYHHGRTPAAWTATVIAIIGSVVSTAGFLLNISWTLVWAGLALLVGAAVVGGIMVKLGYGQSYAD